MLRYVRNLRAAKPFPYPREFMSRALALMWGVGGAILLIVSVVPAPPEMATGPIAAIGGLAVGISALLVAVGTRLSGWAYPVLLLGGTCVVTALIVLGGGGIASVAFTVFFVWVVVYALLFFSGPVAGLQLCAVVVGYATAHALAGDAFTWLVPIVFGGTVGITGVVIAGLSGARTEARLDALTGLVNAVRRTGSLSGQCSTRPTARSP